MITCACSSLYKTLILSPSSSSSSSSSFISITASLPLLKCHPVKIYRGQWWPHTSVSLNFRTSIQQMAISCSSDNCTLVHFKETEQLFSLFQEIGLGEKETLLLLQRNPALSSSSTSLESLNSRLLSLRSIGFNEASLRRSIAKRPEILTATEIDPLLCFIKDELVGEIKPDKLERLLTRTDSRFFVGFAGKVRLLLEHGVPQDKVVRILNHINLTKVLCHKPTKEIEGAILFLIRVGSVELLVRKPTLLNLDLDTQLIPRIEFLTKLSGGDEEATGIVVRKLPSILCYTLEHVQSHVEFLRSFAGLSDQEIFKIVLVYPNIFSVSKERKLVPRIGFLKECGMNSSDTFKFLSKAPLFLSLSYKENLSKKMGFLVKIGYKNGTKELVMALGAVTRSSCQNMQKVIDMFLSYGFSCEDIEAMSTKHPQILQYNYESLRRKMEYLVEEMDREIGELLAFPAFLGYKLDDRIRHRYEAKKKIIGDGMSLNKLLSVSTAKFLKQQQPSKHSS